MSNKPDTKFLTKREAARYLCLLVLGKRSDVTEKMIDKGFKIINRAIKDKSLEPANSSLENCLEFAKQRVAEGKRSKTKKLHSKVRAGFAEIGLGVDRITLDHEPFFLEGDIEGLILTENEKTSIKLLYAVVPRKKAKPLMSVTPPQKTANKGASTFPTPPVAKWEDVKMKFVDGHTIHIKVGDKKGKYTYAEMGMKDGRTANPNHQWELLKTLSENNGEVFFRSDQKLKSKKKELSNALKAFFDLRDDPFEYQGTKYITRFILKPEK